MSCHCWHSTLKKMFSRFNLEIVSTGNIYNNWFCLNEINYLRLLIITEFNQPEKTSFTEA